MTKKDSLLSKVKDIPSKMTEPLRRAADEVGDRIDSAAKAARRTGKDDAKDALAQAKSAKTTAARAGSTAVTAAKKGRTAGRKMAGAAADSAKAAVEAAAKKKGS